MSFVRQRTDVFVIGGGPAGLAAAIAARRKGFSVTVADGGEPPIDKACGEGLMPDTQAALRELGVCLPSGEGYRFRGIGFVQGDVEVAAEFPNGRGTGIRRTLLHQALIDGAERGGVQLLWKTPVIGLDKRTVQLTGGGVKTRWMIGADGSQSRVRRWADLDSPVSNGQRMASRRHYRVCPWSEFMEVYWGHRVQAYVTPVAREEVCVVTMGETMEDAEFERVLQVVPQLRQRLAGAELCSRERGAVTAMQSLARVWRGNVALVGDASGGVDAITGEGLRLAFGQASALAEAMERDDLVSYERKHRELGRRPRWMGRLLLQLGRYDALRSRALRALQRNPQLFSRLLAIHVGHATTSDVLATSAQVGWQFLAMGERN